MIKKDVYIFWSLKRSGAHGFEKWFMPHLHDVLFVNNAKPTRPFSGNKNAQDPKRANVCVGFEDIDFKTIDNLGGIEKIIQKTLPNNQAAKVINIIVLRDPLNLFASRLKIHHDRDKRMYMNESIVSLWKSYAREFLGETSHLSRKVAISFNEWFSNAEYRRDLEVSFNFSHTDEGLDELGIRVSSFDGGKYAGKAHQMKVLDRWHHFNDNAEYKALFDDEELIELSKKIFDMDPKELVLR